MKRTPHLRTQAFTLIELLLVLVILAVLAAVVVPNLLGRGEDAKRKATIASIHSLKNVIKTYETDNGSIPDTNTGLAALVTMPAGLTSGNWHKLLDQIPKDGWGNEFEYRAPSTISDDAFDIVSAGKDGQIGTDDDITQLTER